MIIKELTDVSCNSSRRKLYRFALVGGCGFCVDGGMLTLLTAYGWEILPARGCSFSLAVSVTWILNRLWTFDAVKRISLQREYAFYFVTQMTGAGINLFIFFALIKIHPLLRGTPLIPLAIGAGVALVFNFIVSKKIIFER